MTKYYGVLLLITLFMCSGCEESKKYTVIDHAGNVYKHMIIIDNGLGWTKFQGIDNKVLIVRGEYSYIEE